MTLKISVLFNSFATVFVMVINFIFKIYLAKHFSQINLVAYYTIMDMFSLATRIFSGYKDSLITIFYQHDNKYKTKVLELFSTMFVYVIALISLIIIPILTNYYLSR